VLIPHVSGCFCSTLDYFDVAISLCIVLYRLGVTVHEVTRDNKYSAKWPPGEFFHVVFYCHPIIDFYGKRTFIIWFFIFTQYVCRTLILSLSAEIFNFSESIKLYRRQNRCVVDFELS